jgi:hypothetical protein
VLRSMAGDHFPRLSQPALQQDREHALTSPNFDPFLNKSLNEPKI